MQYRKFGTLDFDVSALGFGCMRLPVREDSTAIDEPLAIDMLRWAIDAGVNYVDTAYPYHSGESEVVVGKALQHGYRERVKLATKLPIWKVDSQDDCERILHEQLDKLQAEHIDFYLVHHLNADRWRRTIELDVLSWLEQQQEKGLVGHIGFSFHDHYELFTEIVDTYPHWVLCQLQYNYVGQEVQAGAKGVEYAATHGLAVVVMEPLLGGSLAAPPAPVSGALAKSSSERSPAAWALSWLWNQPEISVVLSGMSTMQQVEENVRTAASARPEMLSAEELVVLEEARKIYQERSPIACTNCRYCMPCPHGVDIPYNFELYNTAVAYNSPGLGTGLYNELQPESRRAGNCQACGECEEKCPQGLPIREWMTRIHAELGKE